MKLIPLIWVCLTCLLPAGAQPTGYTHSAVLIINHQQVAHTDQSSFPVLISAQASVLKGVSWGGQIQSPNAYDVAFSADSAGNSLLPYERIRHDLQAGRVVYWIQVPQLSHSVDTPIYMWYGSPSVTSDQSNAAAVWDTHYNGVWHFVAAAGSNQIPDSTTNGNGGTISSTAGLTLGAIPNIEVPRFVTNVAAGDSTTIPSGAGGPFDYTTADFTFEFWMYISTAGSAGEIGIFGNGGPDSRYGYAFTSPDGQHLAFNSYATGHIASTTTMASPLSVGKWNHIVIARAGSTMTIYLNGSPNVTNNNYISGTSTPSALFLGNLDVYGPGQEGCITVNGCFQGAFTEFRSSTAARSADWVATSYNNQSNPKNFFSQLPSNWDFTSTGVPPICNAGSPQSFRAGMTATLDGSASSSLTNLPLQYLWQQIPSAAAGIPLQHLRWSSHTVAKPSISGLAFGPANFMLTVTQADGELASCTVNHGAVATDNNGFTITATGNATLDGAISTLLGPMVQLGKNPWPYYDQAAQTDAAVQIAGLDTVYPDYWNVPLPGTVAVTVGSTTVLGNGTNFLSTLCNADGTVNYANGTTALILWYLTNNPSVPGETGRHVIGPNSGPYITGCQSDTQLTLSAPVDNSIAVCPPNQAAPCWLQYSTTAPSGFPKNGWNNGNTPPNYYDAVAAYYALYYRSGQDIYLINARKFADRYWTCPQIDRGQSFVWGFSWPPVFRDWTLMGLVLRALDTSDGHPDMWPGLHKAWASTYRYWSTNYPAPTKTSLDARENGYGLAQLGYCALFDEDPAWQATCRTEIKNLFATSGTGYLNLFPQTFDPTSNGWLALAGTRTSWYTRTTVNLRNGSTSVSCNGTCGWLSTDFAIVSGTGGHPVWFTTPNGTAGALVPYNSLLKYDGNGNVIAASTGDPGIIGGTENIASPGSPVYIFPIGNTNGDPDVYCYEPSQPSLGCTFVDASHFTLDRPYNEPGCDQGCTKGWTFDDGSGNLGYDQNPFMEGILAFAFDLAGRAMACTGTGAPSNCDQPTSQLAYQYATYAANWVMKWGYRPSTHGMYYITGGPVCGWPPAENVGWCAGGSPSAPIASREYAADGLRGLLVYYQRTGDSNAKQMVDTIYGALWGKPGSNAIVPSPDGVYDNNFDVCPGCGEWLSPGGTAGKLFGQMFGFSRQDTWPAIRAGGVAAPATAMLYVSGRIGDVPGAAAMQVTVTEPTGVAISTATCSASPCAVTVPQGVGNPTVQINYISGSGALLRAGQPFTAIVN